MTSGRLFSQLVNIMRRLRSPVGCPWDRAQTPATLTQFIVEECYEVVEAIERGSAEELREELGDLLLQVVFQAQIAEEKELFDIGGVLEGIVDKLRRRHPHVFGKSKADTPAEVLELWHGLKMEEKQADAQKVPLALPALARAQAVQADASAIGFDWPDASGPSAKVVAELEEVKEATASGKKDRVQEEAGDLLFSAVNLCRLLEIDAETALRLTVNKFEERLKRMEKAAAESGRKLAGMTLPEMDELWEQSKAPENFPRPS
jgi:MazG family protein